MAMSDQPPDILTLVPTVPDPKTVDWERAVFIYDPPSDELLLYFDRDRRAGASIALDVGDTDYVYARVDPATGETIGMQIDSFRHYAVGRNPELADILAVAEINGLDDISAAELRRRARRNSQERADPAKILTIFGARTA